MYQHSVFIGTFEALEKAERVVHETVAVEDAFSSNDGETGTLEFRFFTRWKLSAFERRCIVSQVPFESYSFNGEV